MEDSLVAAIAQDPTTVNFMYNCLRAVQSSTMEWLSPTACTDNLHMLTQAENRTLSEDEEVEEILINSALTLLQRLYKIAFIGADVQSVHRVRDDFTEASNPNFLQDRICNTFFSLIYSSLHS